MERYTQSYSVKPHSFSKRKSGTDDFLMTLKQCGLNVVRSESLPEPETI